MIEKQKLGWIPDLPDHRDLYASQVMPEHLLTPRKASNKKMVTLPSRVDISSGFSPIENQLNLGSCTAQAAVGLVEFMERKYLKRHLEGSRLFVYKATRRLSGLQGDSGAYLRDTMKAIVAFGVPEEKYWPYKVSDFDKEPDAFVYSYASNFKTLKYFRVDQTHMSTEEILTSSKIFLSRGIPLMFGTTVYNTIYNVTSPDFIIGLPQENERPIGGHAMVLCGYSDEKASFLVRNSWGTNWGLGGYAWLPYYYIQAGLACDIWGITKQDYIDTQAFD